MADIYTHDWWLERLLKKRAEELSRIASLEAEARGEQELPASASDKARDAWNNLAERARTNWAGLIVNAVTQRIRPIGFTCSGAPTEEENQRIEAEMRRIMSEQDFAVLAADLHGWVGAMGRGAVITGRDEDGNPLMTIEHPEEVVFEVDKRNPQKVLAWSKTWFDDIAMRWRTIVFTDGVAQHYIATQEGTADKQPSADVSSWEYAEEGSEAYDFQPLIPFWNKNGQAEFERSLPLLRRLDALVLQALVTIALQTFRQRAIEGGNFPDKDEDDNPINWDKVFEAGPDALWMLPEGARIWESQQADMAGIRDSINQSLRMLAAVEEMPITVFNPDSAGESAESASLKREGLVFRCEDRIARYRGPWVHVMRNLLRLAGINPDGLDISVVFASPDRISLSERADADSKVRSTLPLRTRLQQIWGYSPEEIERVVAERSEELLEASTFAAMAFPNANQPVGAGAVSVDEPEA